MESLIEGLKGEELDGRRRSFECVSCERPEKREKKRQEGEGEIRMEREGRLKSIDLGPSPSFSFSHSLSPSQTHHHIPMSSLASTSTASHCELHSDDVIWCDKRVRVSSLNSREEVIVFSIASIHKDIKANHHSRSREFLSPVSENKKKKTATVNYFFSSRKLLHFSSSSMDFSVQKRK